MKIQRIVFTHIPKAAGSAVYSALCRTLEVRRPLTGFDHAIFGGFDDFAGIPLQERRHIYDAPGRLPADADLISGHFACSTTRLAYPAAPHMTLLREPITRVLSQWTYWRSQQEASLAAWGSWAARVRTAQQPLSLFLEDPAAACQSDNLATRMMLWPHPLIPGDGFIDPRDDAALLGAALDRLRRYEHVDIIENGAMADRLSRWLGHEFLMDRVNETSPMPDRWQVRLHDELTLAALDLLEQRSRLDLVLWNEIASAVLPVVEIGPLRIRTIMRTVARHASLLLPAGG